MELKQWSIIIGIGATLGSGAFFLERHWNQAAAVADLAMKATSNKKTILEMELQRICEKYARVWPCTDTSMTDQDKARFNLYKGWWEEERRRLDKQMGG
jgi:hypothetical protein